MPEKETTLRPETLEGFLGQKDLKHRLGISLAATKKRGEAFPHQLLAGPPGLGKTTLAGILSKEMGKPLRITSGPALEKPGDLASTLVSLEEGDFLFIDEIHRLPAVVEEFLYPAMEDRKIDILIENSENCPKAVRLDLKAFTLIGATTKPGLLSAPLRSRFQTIHKLELYKPEELAEIVEQSAERLGLTIEKDAALAVGKCSRGTPRIANNHLLWIRDYWEVSEKRSEKIDEPTTIRALEEIGVYRSGLDRTDLVLLDRLINTFHGGPVGLQTLALAANEDPTSVEDIHEPYLIAEGYIKRGPQGRIALEKAFQAVGSKKQQRLNLT